MLGQSLCVLVYALGRTYAGFDCGAGMGVKGGGSWRVPGQGSTTVDSRVVHRHGKGDLGPRQPTLCTRLDVSDGPSWVSCK